MWNPWKKFLHWKYSLVIFIEFLWFCEFDTFTLNMNKMIYGGGTARHSFALMKFFIQVSAVLKIHIFHSYIKRCGFCPPFVIVSLRFSSFFLFWMNGKKLSRSYFWRNVTFLFSHEQIGNVDFICTDSENYILVLEILIGSFHRQKVPTKSISFTIELSFFQSIQSHFE